MNGSFVAADDRVERRRWPQSDVEFEFATSLGIDRRAKPLDLEAQNAFSQLWDSTFGNTTRTLSRFEFGFSAEFHAMRAARAERFAGANISCGSGYRSLDEQLKGHPDWG